VGTDQSNHADHPHQNRISMTAWKLNLRNSYCGAQPPLRSIGTCSFLRFSSLVVKRRMCRIENLAKNASWTSALGEAYHTQAADVMSAPQALRAKAKAAGNLKSDSQERSYSSRPT